MPVVNATANLLPMCDALLGLGSDVLEVAGDEGEGSTACESDRAHVSRPLATSATAHAAYRTENRKSRAFLLCFSALATDFVFFFSH